LFPFFLFIYFGPLLLFISCFHYFSLFILVHSYCLLVVSIIFLYLFWSILIAYCGPLFLFIYCWKFRQCPKNIEWNIQFSSVQFGSVQFGSAQFVIVYCFVIVGNLLIGQNILVRYYCLLWTIIFVYLVWTIIFDYLVWTIIFVYLLWTIIFVYLVWTIIFCLFVVSIIFVSIYYGPLLLLISCVHYFIYLLWKDNDWSPIMDHNFW
jgi:hypothetical protein